MVPIKLLIFILTFYQLFLDPYALQCQPGQRLRPGGWKSCETCPEDNFQPKENSLPDCKPCTRCEENRGSVAIKKCTKTMDTICDCRGGYVPWGNDKSACKCEIGFGIQNGECLKCKDGYFSASVNSHCQKWRECKAGIKTAGTRTSNVVCKKSNSTTHITHSPLQQLTTKRIPSTSPATSATTSSSPAPTIQVRRKSFPTLGFVIALGIVGLVLLTAVTCRLHFCRYAAEPEEQKPDVLLSNPIEESGDSSQK